MSKLHHLKEQRKISKIYVVCLPFFILFSFNLKAQTLGTIKGKVKDSTYKFVLSSSTVAIYKNIDSSLLQFCIPDNLGEFSLTGLPLGDTLRLQITHVGYTTYENKFLISPANNLLDLGWIYMHQTNKDDEEVTVTAIAPVRMNGDTLEFNPRAFKMDANATAEDLMRRLPGFTIWSDGDITFNGKKIKALFVDGKPFMGGTDVTVATQNLPKEVLDKVQVYQQRDEKNPLDSTLMANLKLKDDKKMGYFGKIGIGIGTDKRYTADAMISGFNKKLQVNVVGATNNINKIADNTDELIRNSSFKGENTALDYQPDFTMAGLNRPVQAGLKFQYDFIPNTEYQKRERLNADYFLNHNNAQVNGNTTVRTMLTSDTTLTKHTESATSNIYSRQNFNSNYNKSERAYELSIGAKGGINYNKYTNSSSDIQDRSGLGIISQGSLYSENQSVSRDALITFEFTKRNNWYNSLYLKRKRIPTDFTLRYQFGVTGTDGSGRNKSSFNFTPASGQQGSTNYDRLYQQRDNNSKSHNLYLQYPYLKQLIFGKKTLGNIDLKISSNFAFQNNDFTDIVLDMDTISKLYLPNFYLTNIRHENISNIQPELIVARQFQKGLTNRYNKYVNIELIARNQYYSVHHNATQLLQNFNYRYNRFMPQASVSYNNHQYGSYEARYNFKYETNVGYPTVNQIAPLVDSTNVWFIAQGNRNLQPEFTNRYAISYDIESRKPKNPIGFGFNAEYIQVKNKMADSSFYDNAGRMLVYTVNVNGYKYWRAGTNIKKAYSPNKNNTFELTTSYNIYRRTSPQYINKTGIISKNLSQNIDGQLGYTFKDIVAMRIQQGLLYYKSIQTNTSDGEGFNSNTIYSRFSGMLQLPKNLTWSSNITYNKSSSNNQLPIRYTIWNASLTYRFLEGNRGEVKFSALDMLRQNKSIINTVDRNTQTFGYKNVLQQYFMISLSYYPRKFGK